MVTVFCSMYTIVLLFYFISFKNINFNLIDLFKLQHLLHNQIDPTVKLMKKKQSQLKYKRAQEDQTTSVLPISTSSWCLNRKILKKFNCTTDNILVYDYNTDEDNEEDHGNKSNNTEENDDLDEENFGKRKKNKIKSLTAVFISYRTLDNFFTECNSATQQLRLSENM